MQPLLFKVKLIRVIIGPFFVAFAQYPILTVTIPLLYQ